MKVFIVFGGVIADTEANKKLSLVIKGKRIPRFVCFYIITFFQSTWNYKTIVENYKSYKTMKL